MKNACKHNTLAANPQQLRSLSGHRRRNKALQRLALWSCRINY
ncbi:Unknown protein sequence [Pseudomonas syringae pv. maculicola]|nr:Unknown protein sequence [Pseudomonas syringae pv. maculicola]